MNYKIFVFALLAFVWCFAASVVMADVIPLRGVVADERMLLDGQEFRLTAYNGVDMAVVMVIYGEIRFRLYDGPVATGFTLKNMESVILTGSQAAVFRAVSLEPKTMVRFIYFSRDRTQADIIK